MKKRTHGIVVAVLIAGLAAVGAVWLLTSGTPSYDKICRLNDELKQARQLGLSSRGECAERLGNAILKTTDESLLAKLLANVSFAEEGFAHAILNKIKDPEMVEAVARTFRPELLVGGSDVQVLPPLYKTVLDRLPDDDAVERVVGFRLEAFGDDPDAKTNDHEKDSSGKSELVASLLRRIYAMENKERAESLMEKMADSGVFRAISSDARLEIALRTKNEKLRQAMDVDQETLELGDLVAKWDPACLSRPVREILDRGRKIKDAQEYVETVKRFDPDFRSNDIDKWVEYAKSATPILEAIDRLSANTGADSSDSFRRSSIVEKRDKAKKDVDEYKKVIDEVRAAVRANNIATIMAACQFVDVRFDASDPEDTGWRLGNELKRRYQEAKSEMEAAERELAALDRAASSQREKTNGEIDRLKSKLEQIRQRYENPETRKAREEREAAERKAREEREAAERKAREEREAAERKAKEEARRAALTWKGKTKRVPISDSVSIKLRSVPGNLWFGQYEVTQAQWETVMGEPCPIPRYQSDYVGPDLPAIYVSWDDCQAFLKKLNALPTVKNSGLTFRLPTYAEWEAACRAGATGDYCLLADGTEITEETLGQVAWFKGNSDEKMHPVGEKTPNAWGLYDMHGNVDEWCQDEIGEVWDCAKGKDFEHDRVHRGGCWVNSVGLCRSSNRYHWSSSLGVSSLGFRLCASGSSENDKNKALVEDDNSDKGLTKEKKKKKAAKEQETEGDLKTLLVLNELLDELVAIPGKNVKICKYEVTQTQWNLIMGANPSRFKGANNPVENISWNDCQTFLAKLNAEPVAQEAELVFRLPTDSEWEYACRAGSKGNYCTLTNGIEVAEEEIWEGDTTLADVAWFKKNSDGKTHPVGLKEPNAFGLYDMHGNVWEWTSTRQYGSFTQCGGALNSDASRCTVLARSFKKPDERFANVGFRLCISEGTD